MYQTMNENLNQNTFLSYVFLRVSNLKKKQNDYLKEKNNNNHFKRKFAIGDKRIVNYESNFSDCCRSLPNVRSDEQSAREFRFRSDSTLAIFT